MLIKTTKMELQVFFPKEEERIKIYKTQQNKTHNRVLQQLQNLYIVKAGIMAETL